MADLKNNLHTIDGWQIIENRFDPDLIVTTGSNFMIGNGYLGYRGTFAEWEQEHFVACTVTDTWDTAPGSEWRELCTVPNGLFAQLWVDGEQFTAFSGVSSDYHRELNLQYGLNRRSVVWQGAHGKRVRYGVEKFASMDQYHLVPMRLSIEAMDDTEIVLTCGVDGRIWSLNGEHFQRYETFQEADLLGIETHTHEFAIQVNVVTGLKISGAEPKKVTVKRGDRRILRTYSFSLQAGERVTIEQIMAVCHSNHVENSRETATRAAAQALDLGFDGLYKRHQAKWHQIWSVSDIEIEGNLEAQTLTRFNLYHAIIATPTHAKLPIGARGLSCQVYQGAAFWDQETFNLPMYLYTNPAVARKLIEYRYDTLPGARKKAHDLGYYGAFYAWTSGKTGEELFPDYFFTDVLTGRKIHNHFNSWQIHISPDIVYALWLYFEASGDWDFMLNFGAEIAFEVAQFLVSRVHFKMDKERYEFIRLLGPDEYHENVDNNAYTNYLAQFALEKAAYLYQRLAVEAPQRLDQLLNKIGVDRAVINAWVDIITRIYLPEPDPETKLIEQFDGFFNLEDMAPEALRQRLIDPEEYWGWPNGIAVEAQVLKQADLLQLFALLDDKFSHDVMRANYDYYEPRTEHGSSLSPSVHATVAAWVDYPEEAYRYFLEAATIDLYNASKKVVSGGSFLGGIHTAAAGAVWQMIVKGFAGFKLVAGVLHFRPALPTTWECVSFKLVIHGNWITVTLRREDITFTAGEQNSHRLDICVADRVYQVSPAETICMDYAQTI
jgi:1,2-alpha-glucosylglycerol phosphorylase